MTTTTPNLGLVLYDSSGDQAATFATWRAVIDGPATTSNFYKIDTAYGTQASQITSLQATRGAIRVPSIFQSSNFYSVTGITAITAYTLGMTIILSVDIDSNGTVTLDINSLGIKSVMKTNSSGTPINLTGSDLNAGRYYLFMYDGTRWMWVDANSGDQINVDGTAGNVLTVNTDNTILGTLTQSLLISQTTHAATAKTTLADADEIGLVDSAASNVLKRITWSNIATAMGVKWGSVIDALTGKTTPVDADELAIADSAASFATKKLTWANLKATLKTYFDTIYRKISFTTTATAAGTTTLTVSSSEVQEFTGTTTQTVVLPVVSTLTIGQTYTIINNSTGIVTVNSSGSNLVQAMAANTCAVFVCISITGTTAASWDVQYSSSGTSASADGWTAITDTWTYASATTITIPSDGTLVYQRGMKVRFKQGGGYKYYLISTVASTLLTTFTSSDYSVANSAITDISYSLDAAPLGFPTFLNVTVGYTGFSANPTTTYAKFYVNGDVCWFWYQQNALGTSNATTFTITGLPVAVATSATVLPIAAYGADNSANIATPIRVDIATTILTLSKAITAAGGWTASGTKGVYTIILPYVY